MKKLILAASLAALFTAGQALAETIKIGVTPAEHAQIMEQVKKIAAVAPPSGLERSWLLRASGTMIAPAMKR